MIRRTAAFAMVLAGCIALLGTSSAQAARYDAVVCSAPQGTTTNPWALESNSALFTMDDDCATGGSIDLSVAFPGGNLSNFFYGRAQYFLPAVQLVGVRGRRTANTTTSIAPGDAAGGGMRVGLFARTGFNSYQEIDAIANQADEFAQVGPSDFSWAAPAPVNASSLTIRAVCEPDPDTGNTCYEPNSHWTASELVAELDDAVPPAGSVQGTLALDPVLSGVEEFRSLVNDVGIGLASARLVVDDVTRDTFTLGTPCSPITSSPTPLYRSARPCSQSDDPLRTFDTSVLADGPHRFRVFASDAVGNEAVLMDRTVDVRNGALPPEALGLPTISGVAQVGSTLIAAPPAFDANGVLPLSLAYAWLRCEADGSACAPVNGATSAQRLVNPADVGKTLRVRVTASNDAGTSAVTSAATAAVSTATVTPSTPPAQGQEVVVQQIVKPAPLPPITVITDAPDSSAITFSLLSPKKQQVRRGTRVYFGGATRTVGGKLPVDVSVRIQARRKRGWVTVRTVKTARNGTYSTSLRVFSSRSYRAVAPRLGGQRTQSKALRLNLRRIG